MANAYLAIIPAYNEEATVARVIEEIARHAPEFDALVVDDGSTDATFSRAVAAGASVVRHPFNLGLGASVHTGYKYACEHGYEVTVQVDGDGQHDATHLRDLVRAHRARPGADIITGSRFVERRGDGYVGSLGRRSTIRVFSRIISSVLRQPVTDPTSGFRMVCGRALRIFAIDRPHADQSGWGGDVVEAILLAHHHRLRWEEVPVRMRSRAGGSSAIPRVRTVYYSMTKVLFAVLVGLLRRRAAKEPVEPIAPSLAAVP
jgi:glycosyltransferase involved in cell wall biosynthesis